MTTTYIYQTEGADTDPILRARDWVRNWMFILKRQQGCALCGRRDGHLVYHHTRYGAGSCSPIGLYNHKDFSRWLDEIDKCVVLCLSCHSLHHAGHAPADGACSTWTPPTGQEEVIQLELYPLVVHAEAS